MSIQIVLVDDQPDLRELLSMCLVPEFRVVGEAGTGREAIDVVAAHSPDLVVMDLSMPDMDGLEAIRSIRSKGDAKIAVLSGFQSDKLAQAVRDQGAVCYIEKGVPLETLKAELASAAQADVPAVLRGSDMLDRRVSELV